MNIYEYEILRPFIESGPVVTFWFFLLADFGVLALMNIVDLAYVRGFGRPQKGHLAYWAIAVYDTAVLPLAAAYAVVLYRQTEILSSGLGWESGLTITVVSGLIGIAVAVGFAVIDQKQMMVKPEMSNWSVSDKGTNIVGYYHTFIMALYMQFFLAFAVRMLIYAGRSGHLLTESIVFILGFVVITVGFLVADQNQKVISPGELLAKTTHREELSRF